MGKFFVQKCFAYQKQIIMANLHYDSDTNLNQSTTYLRYDPDTNLNRSTMYLTHDKKSWITIEHLDDNIKQYAIDNFNAIFELHPQDKGKVLVFNGNIEDPNWVETECSIWYQSYDNTPKFDDSVMKSYMFSDRTNTNINEPLPKILVPFYECIKKNDNNYNQVVVNWYNPDDMIPYHSDCEAYMMKNHSIGLINLLPSLNQNNYHEFKLLSKDKIKSLFDEVTIVLKHGIIITMGGELQKTFRHGVEINTTSSQRISLSFRQFDKKN